MIHFNVLIKSLINLFNERILFGEFTFKTTQQYLFSANYGSRSNYACWNLSSRYYEIGILTKHKKHIVYKMKSVNWDEEL